MKKRTGLPAGLEGFEDDAIFILFVNEEKLGRLESAWKRDGTFEARTTVTLGGQTVESRVCIAPAADGSWAAITSESPIGVRTITRQGSAVTRTFKEKTSTFETPEGAVLFENEAPALMSQALRLYDRARGGPQPFPLLIGGRPPVELVLEATGLSDAGLTRFRYGVPGLDLYALADESGRIYMVEIPAQKAAMVRAGHEALRDAQEALFEVVVERNVGIPVRDGIHLSTDIYLPRSVERAPLVLARTPYKKELLELQAMFYARRGYVFAAQDCRGRFGSPGVWEPWVHEGRDGYDTIEWLSGQPYSSGRVGMIGGSYVGLAQWCALAERPPHLACIIPNVSPPDPFHNIPYEYGAFFLWGSIWWSEVNESGAAADISGAGLSRISDRKYAKLLRTLPVIDLDKVVLGKESAYWRRWIEHPTNDSYWAPADFTERLADADIPVFHQSGWFDGDAIGAKLNYLKMVSHGHANQKLTVGPWGHTDTAHRMVRDRDFGENAIIDLQGDYLRWLDRWLKGVDNGIEHEPLVSLFVMGANDWVHGSTYPLEMSRPRKLYLAAGGKLTFDTPPEDSDPDRYSYDPGDPTPSPQFYQESEEDEKKTRTAEERKKEAEHYHRLIADERDDILVYETEPFTNALSFAGPVSAVLYATSSAVDTDWFVTLSEIEESGRVFQLVKGKLRARFRKSLRAPELLTPHEVNEYALDLWHTAIRIPPGAKLRVEIASADFPLFSRNLNTGGHNETETEFLTAEQTIYHDARYPSHILLPVIDYKFKIDRVVPAVS